MQITAYYLITHRNTVSHTAAERYVPFTPTAFAAHRSSVRDSLWGNAAPIACGCMLSTAPTPSEDSMPALAPGLPPHRCCSARCRPWPGPGGSRAQSDHSYFTSRGRHHCIHTHWLCCLVDAQGGGKSCCSPRADLVSVHACRRRSMDSSATMAVQHSEPGGSSRGVCTPGSVEMSSDVTELFRCNAWNSSSLHHHTAGFMVLAIGASPCATYK